MNSGLYFWFTPSEAKAKIPVRWKQFLITWSAIYVLAILILQPTNPILTKIGVPHYFASHTFVNTEIIVFLMAYVVMPRYTKLVSNWLFNK